MGRLREVAPEAVGRRRVARRGVRRVALLVAAAAAAAAAVVAVASPRVAARLQHRRAALVARARERADRADERCRVVLLRVVQLGADAPEASQKVGGHVAAPGRRVEREAVQRVRAQERGAAARQRVVLEVDDVPEPQGLQALGHALVAHVAARPLLHPRHRPQQARGAVALRRLRAAPPASGGQRVLALARARPHRGHRLRARQPRGTAHRAARCCTAGNPRTGAPGLPRLRGGCVDQYQTRWSSDADNQNLKLNFKLKLQLSSPGGGIPSLRGRGVSFKTRRRSPPPRRRA